MKIRIARIFTGTKKIARFEEKMQYFDDGQWKNVETEWQSKEDEEKYKKAEGFEYARESR